MQKEDTEPSLQSTKIDLETRMGLVFKKDQYYLDKKLGGKWEKVDVNRLAPRIPSLVHYKLTAEEVFASRNKDEVQIPGPVFDVGGEFCKDCAEALSESEGVRYLGLVRIHRMAALTLYHNRCYNRPIGDKAEALSIIENQFRKLPKEAQQKALDHQAKAIELQRAVYYNNHITDPGRFERFCSKMTDGINSGYADPMFMTAKEGFFPIERN